MKRRIALLLATASIAAVGMFAPASPASAHEDACVGQGTATLSTGLGYPVLFPANTANFSFTFGLGTCVNKTTLHATGTVTGNCGLSFGAGVTNNGHRFTFTSTGTVLVLSGEVTGVVNAIPDPTHSGSCTNKTATRFLITGSVALTHVAPSLPQPCSATNTAC